MKSDLQMMTLNIIGAGAVATCLSPRLKESGHEILAVASRSKSSSETLAEMLGCLSFNDLSELPIANCTLICVSDDALPSVAAEMGRLQPGSLLVHTSGGIGLDVFGERVKRSAVMYPLQTFSKGVELDVSEVPLFVEASNGAAMKVVKDIADSISRSVFELDGEGRARLHVAAVFASNFVNHCYTLASDLMRRFGFDWNWLLPLIDETARKVHDMPPTEAQTGPAARGDFGVLDKELNILGADRRLASVYEMMSRSIMRERNIQKYGAQESGLQEGL